MSDTLPEHDNLPYQADTHTNNTMKKLTAAEHSLAKKLGFTQKGTNFFTKETRPKGPSMVFVRVDLAKNGQWQTTVRDGNHSFRESFKGERVYHKSFTDALYYADNRCR